MARTSLHDLFSVLIPGARSQDEIEKSRATIKTLETYRELSRFYWKARTEMEVHDLFSVLIPDARSQDEIERSRAAIRASETYRELSRLYWKTRLEMEAAEAEKADKTGNPAPSTAEMIRKTLTPLSEQKDTDTMTDSDTDTPASTTPQRTRPTIDVPETIAHFHPQVWINDEAVDVDIRDETSCVLSEEDAAWVAMNLGDNADLGWILESDTSPIPSWVRDHIRLYPCSVIVTGEHINTLNQTLTQEFLAARDASAEHTVISTPVPVTTLTQEQITTVLDFINERPRYVSALKQCPFDDHDYWCWSGHSQARRHLAERLGIIPPAAEGSRATHKED